MSIFDHRIGQPSAALRHVDDIAVMRSKFVRCRDRYLLMRACSSWSAIKLDSARKIFGMHIIATCG